MEKKQTKLMAIYNIVLGLVKALKTCYKPPPARANLTLRTNTLKNSPARVKQPKLLLKKSPARALFLNLEKNF